MIFYPVLSDTQKSNDVLQISSNRIIIQCPFPPLNHDTPRSPARSYPVYKAQHHAAQFQRSFDPFCPAPKNRHITLQPSNDRITIQFSFPPPYHITPRSPRPPLPRVKRTVPSDPFSALIFCTALKNRHIILQTSNCRIVARRFKTPS